MTIGATAESPGAKAARRTYILIILTLAYAFAHIDRSVVGVLLPGIKHQFHVGDTALAFLSGLAFAIFFIILGIPIAVWADRGSRRNVIALSVAVWSAMTAVCGLAGTFVQLVGARVGVGIGEAGLTPPTHSLISDLYPPRSRAFALAVYSSGVYLGVLLGFAGGGFLAQHLGWRRTFFVVGIPGLLIALLIRFTITEPKRGLSDVVGPEGQPYENLLLVLVRLWRTRATRYAYIGIALCAMVTQTQAVWLPSFLVRSHHMHIGKAGLLLGLAAGVGGGVGTLLGGKLSDSLGARDERWRLWIVTAAMLALPVCTLAVLFAQNLSILVVMMTVAAMLGAIHLAPTAAVIQNLMPPRMRARAASIVIFILNLLGLGLGPLIVGALSDHLRPIFGANSLRYALTPVILFALLSAAAYFAAGKAYGADPDSSLRTP